MQALKYRWWLPILGIGTVVALIAGLYWLLSIEGTVLVSRLPLDPNAQFPQYVFDPPAPKPGDEVLVSVTITCRGLTWR